MRSGVSTRSIDGDDNKDRRSLFYWHVRSLALPWRRGGDERGKGRVEWIG